MGRDTTIEWAHHTLALELSCGRKRMLFSTRRARWNGLQMDFLVAILAQRKSIANLKSKLREVCIRLQMMGMQVTTLLVTTMLAGIVVTFKNSSTPEGIFHRAPGFFITLMPAISVGVMSSASRRSLLGNSADFSFGFGRVFYARSVAAAPLCSLTHLQPGLFTHFLSLHRRNKRLAALNPCRLDFLPGFLRVFHSIRYTFNPC